jgi:uncharacterized membrane protein YtjA (UPF0391 family)
VRRNDIDGGALIGQVNGSGAMLYWALVFLIISLIAAVFGFGGVSAAAGDIARILFFVFLVLFVLSLIFGLTRRRR